MSCSGLIVLKHENPCQCRDPWATKCMHGHECPGATIVLRMSQAFAQPGSVSAQRHPWRQIAWDERIAANNRGRHSFKELTPVCPFFSLWNPRPVPAVPAGNHEPSAASSADLPSRPASSGNRLDLSFHVRPCNRSSLRSIVRHLPSHAF